MRGAKVYFGELINSSSQIALAWMSVKPGRGELELYTTILVLKFHQFENSFFPGDFVVCVLDALCDVLCWIGILRRNGMGCE